MIEWHNVQLKIIPQISLIIAEILSALISAICGKKFLTPYTSYLFPFFLTFMKY